MQPGAVFAQPALGVFDISGEFLDLSPETAGMIHMCKMRDFMGDHVVYHRFRSQNQPP